MLSSYGGGWVVTYRILVLAPVPMGHSYWDLVKVGVGLRGVLGLVTGLAFSGGMSFWS